MSGGEIEMKNTLRLFVSSVPEFVYLRVSVFRPADSVSLLLSVTGSNGIASALSLE